MVDGQSKWNKNMGMETYTGHKGHKKEYSRKGCKHTLGGLVSGRKRQAGHWWMH